MSDVMAGRDLRSAARRAVNGWIAERLHRQIEARRQYLVAHRTLCRGCPDCERSAASSRRVTKAQRALCTQLRAAREAAGLSREDVAVAMGGVDVEAVAALERGGRHVSLVNLWYYVYAVDATIEFAVTPTARQDAHE